MWGKIAAIGGSLIGGAMKSGSAKKARKHAERQLDKQLAFAQGIFDQQREDTRHYREGGEIAFDQLMAMSGLPSRRSRFRRGRGVYNAGQNAWAGRTINTPFGTVTIPGSPGGGGGFWDYGQETTQRSPLDILKADPGYQWRLEQGEKGLHRGGAARGGLLSGGMVSDIIKYNQGFAAQEYQNAYNRIANIAGLGQVGTGMSHANTPSVINAASDAFGRNAAYGASAYVGQGNAWADVAGDIGTAINDILNERKYEVDEGGFVPYDNVTILKNR